MAATLLDIRTLILVFTVVRVSQAVALLYVWRTQRNYPPARYWALGALLCAIGLLLIGLRDLIPAWVSIVLANALLILGWMIFDAGIAKAAGSDPPLRAGVAIAVIAVVFNAWHTIVTPSYAMRVLDFSVAALVYNLYTIYACLHYKSGSRFVTFRIVALLLAIETASGSWRAIDGYVRDLPSLLSPAFAQTQSVIVSIAFALIITTLLVLLTAQLLQDELNDRAYRDSLTKALNRRAFDEFAEREWKRALRHGHALSFLMLDVDHFKTFNDDHGHPAGDAALARISATARANLRPEDFWFRYGGEEFVAMLPQAGGDQAIAIAERLRSAIEAVSHATPNGRRSLSVSIGAAERTLADTNWVSVIDAADRALYRAKSAGRNRVVLAEPAART